MRTTGICGFVFAMIGFVSISVNAAAPEASPAYIWWEGEDAKETNLPDDRDSGTYPAMKAMPAEEKEKLSNGAWRVCSADGANAPYFLKYEIKVPADATFNFWVRKFWHHGSFKWRFDEQEWRTCDNKIALADSVQLRKFFCVNWMALGEVKLNKGSHVLHIEFLDKKAGGCLDCFMLIQGAFFPHGKLKPDEKLDVKAPAGWFTFQPGTDSFADSPIDLRCLNQKEAGESGFLKTKDGGFVFEKSDKPVRFMAVNIGPNEVRWDKLSQKYFARLMAKLGVNMVRFHPLLDSYPDDPEKINMDYVHNLQHFVQALKKEGIYSNFSMYYVLSYKPKAEAGIEGYTGGKNPFGALCYNSRMQAIYKSWAKAVLTAPNPVSGIPLAQDPAVGIISIENEDDLFFWTVNSLPQEQKKILGRQFGDWLVKKYGSLDKAKAEWENASDPGDNFASGIVGLLSVWNATPDGLAKFPQNRKRMGDQVRFFTETQREMYSGMEKWYRNELGIKCLINATNWCTANDQILGALDKYSNAVCEVIDRHGYFGAPFVNETGAFGIVPGALYDDKSSLFTPEHTCIKEIRYIDHPHTVTELNWTVPNRFRAEYPLLSAAYGAMQGTDGIFHFAANSANWCDSYTHPCMTSLPTVMGQFTGTSLLYRNGYVKRGETVVHEALRLSDLYNLKGSALAGPFNADAAEQAQKASGGKAQVDTLSSIDPLSYYVGVVTRNVADDPGKSVIRDLSAYIDHDKKIVKSMTGELTWNYGQGFMTVNAPCAQGATGFFAKSGKIELADIAIESGNEYGAILAVSIDGKPLRESGKIMLQVMTEDMPSGWKTTEVQHELEKGKGQVKMLKITDTGHAPMLIRNLEGLVILKRPDAANLKVTALDFNGYKRQEIGGASAIKLLSDCLYYVITK